VGHFPDPDKFRKPKDKSPYRKISNWIGDGNTVDLLHDMPQRAYESTLKNVPGLADLIGEIQKGNDAKNRLFLMELALHGLEEFSLISKHNLATGNQFKDLLSSMFTLPRPGEVDEDEDDQDDDVAGGKF